MLIGYTRVSKADGSQALDLQRDALLGAGIPAGQLYEDHASGKQDDRPGLEACLKALRSGDTLVAWKLDRLGRDLRHLVNVIHDLTGRGVGLKVLAGQGANLDTTTANGRLIFGIFAALAEFERELIIERTRAGLASARARGRNGGRPFKMTAAKLRRAQAAMGQPGANVGELCAELGVTRQTLYRHVHPRGALRTDGESFSGRAGGRKGRKPDGQPLQHDATKYAHHTAAEVDFDNLLKSELWTLSLARLPDRGDRRLLPANADQWCPWGSLMPHRAPPREAASPRR